MQTFVRKLKLLLSNYYGCYLVQDALLSFEFGIKSAIRFKRNIFPINNDAPLWHMQVERGAGDIVIVGKHDAAWN